MDGAVGKRPLSRAFRPCYPSGAGIWLSGVKQRNAKAIKEWSEIKVDEPTCGALASPILHPPRPANAWPARKRSTPREITQVTCATLSSTTQELLPHGAPMRAPGELPASGMAGAYLRNPESSCRCPQRDPAGGGCGEMITHDHLESLGRRCREKRRSEHLTRGSIRKMPTP